jgi:hypothetical protein
MECVIEGICETKRKRKPKVFEDCFTNSDEEEELEISVQPKIRSRRIAQRLQAKASSNIDFSINTLRKVIPQIEVLLKFHCVF